MQDRSIKINAMPNVKSPLTLGDLAKRVSGLLKVNQVLYMLLIVAVFLLGYLVARVQMLEKNQGLSSQTQTTQTQTGGQVPQQKTDVKPGKLPVLGKDSAKITMIEFSDFECPFCKRYFDETLPQVIKDYVDRGLVKLNYRHFPLDFHPAAMPSALASECANEQGKFWEYHNKIFNEQDKVSEKTADVITSQLKTWAEDLGLNTSQFNQCLNSSKYQTTVDQDLSDGKAAGVSGTPTFYINGRQLVGAQPFAAFKAIIDEELKK